MYRKQVAENAEVVVTMVVKTLVVVTRMEKTTIVGTNMKKASLTTTAAHHQLLVTCRRRPDEDGGRMTLGAVIANRNGQGAERLEVDHP